MTTTEVQLNTIGVLKYNFLPLHGIVVILQAGSELYIMEPDLTLAVVAN